MSAGYAPDRIVADPDDWTTIDSAQWHTDAVADTGNGYTEFHGYVLDCLWCNYKCRARLQRDARQMMEAHFDRLHTILTAVGAA